MLRQSSMLAHRGCCLVMLPNHVCVERSTGAQQVRGLRHLHRGRDLLRTLFVMTSTFGLVVRSARAERLHAAHAHAHTSRGARLGRHRLHAQFYNRHALPLLFESDVVQSPGVSSTRA